jgi:hypothetical protein
MLVVWFQGTAASTKNKLPTLITSMESIGAKALEEFADSIKARPLIYIIDIRLNIVNTMNIPFYFIVRIYSALKTYIV